MKDGEAFSVMIDGSETTCFHKYGSFEQKLYAKCIDCQNNKISWRAFENNAAFDDLLGTELVIIHRQMC